MNGWNWARRWNRNISFKRHSPLPPARQNALLLVSCFLFALVLWMYVAGSEPDAENLQATTHDASVQVDFLNSRFRVLSPDRAMVNVSWQARSDYGSNANVRAWADLGSISVPGRHTVVVHPRVSSNQIVSGVTVSPDHLTIFVDDLDVRDVPVTFQTSKHLPTGYVAGTPTLSPLSVSVTGPSSLLPSVRATATLDLTNLTDDVDETLPVRLVGMEDADQNLFTVEPAKIRTYVPIQHEMSYASLPVSPIFVGVPAGDIAFLRADVEPSVVTVSGPPATLQSVVAIPTQPIKLTGHKDSFDVQAGLSPPPDIQIQGQPAVVVHVRLGLAGSPTLPGGPVPSPAGGHGLSLPGGVRAPGL